MAGRRQRDCRSGAGVAIGIAIGAAIGAALGEPALGIAIGASVGATVEGGRAAPWSNRNDGTR